MRFVVILISLAINYLWLKDFDRFDDAWFFKLRGKVEGISANLTKNSPRSWLFDVIALYLIPLLLLGLALYLAQGLLFGLLTLLLSVLVLLVAFDRTQPGKVAKDFLVIWEQSDEQGCADYLQNTLPKRMTRDESGDSCLLTSFKRQFTYLCFQKMFVMFIWYMFLGPMAVLFCYISYQLDDGNEDDAQQAQRELMHRIILVLEWLPVRLLGLSFSLAGDFVRCFEQLKQSFWSFDKDASQLLCSYINAALVSKSSNGDSDNGSQDSDVEQGKSIEQGAQEIMSLQALLERSQAIWLIFLAVATIFGFQI